jgi:hypothetical protein
MNDDTPIEEPGAPKSTSPKQSKTSRKKPLDKLSIEILKIVDAARFVVSDDLAELLERIPKNTLQVKLKTLTAQGFLSRPEAQKKLDKERGRNPLVYALGRAGAELLEVPYEIPHRRFRFMEHALLLSRVYVTFLAGSLKEGASIEQWEREPQDRLPSFRIPEMRHAFPHGFRNRPDGFMDYETDRLNRFIIETETGEVAPTRTDFRQSSILRKVLYYRELFKLTETSQYPPFRVLFFIKDAEAKYFNDCRKVCCDADPRRVGLNIFWFTFFENVRVARPEVMLHEPFWYTPSAQKPVELL